MTRGTHFPEPRSLRTALPALLAALSVAITLSSCATIPDDTLTMMEDEEHPLYGGSSVTISRDSPVERRRQLEREMENAIRPEPNTTWFGTFRPWLGVHILLEDPQEEGFRAWLYERFAEEPVFFDSSTPVRTTQTLERWLFDRGFFHSEITFETREQDDVVRVEYDVAVEEPYRIGSIRWPSADTKGGENDTPAPEAASPARAEDRSEQDRNRLYRMIADAAKHTLVRPGDQYSLETLRRERTRIDRFLKNRGYYAFSPDYLIFSARRDTETRTVDLHLTVRDDTPREALLPYRIGTITVYTDYDPTGDADPAEQTDREIAENYRLIENRQRYRAELITAAILFQPGDTYRRREQLHTVDRLMGLGVFRFANIRYRTEPGTHGILHAEVLLTPAPEKTIEGELRAVTRSDGFAGPGASIRYRDRNVFSGAETLTMDLRGGFETLIGTDLFQFDTWETGIETTLSIPRTSTLFGVDFDRRGPTMPRTTLRGDLSSVSRIDRYRQEQISASVGYEWNTGDRLEHDLRPLDASYVRHETLSDAFREQLEQNPGLLDSFEDQFILGASYRLRYRNGVMFYGRFDTAGTALSLVRSLSTDRLPDPEDPFTIGTVRYSQFVRLETSTRYSHPVTDGARLVGRLFVGAGYAFGNSSVMPRVKQFALGGPNSLRAFQPRTIGPGALPPATDGGPEVERTGDVRIEANLEYRFDITGIIKGAIFADAGNIWTLRNGEEAGALDPARIPEQTALGAGLGIRLDPDVVVIRLDAGTPLRKPWLPPGERWILDEITPIFNLSLGYPF